jgi:hypothetical protein
MTSFSGIAIPSPPAEPESTANRPTFVSGIVIPSKARNLLFAHTFDPLVESSHTA